MSAHDEPDGPAGPASVPPRPSLGPTPSVGTSVVASRALGEEQSARARTSLWTALWLSLLAGLALQLTRNKNVAHWVLTGTILALAAACAAVLYEARGQKAIEPRRMLVTGVMTVLVTLAATARLGVLTPTFAFLIVTVYYNSSGDWPFEAIIYGLSAVGYLALIVLCYVGVLPLTDAVLAMVEQNDRALIGFGVVAEGMLFATYRMARQNRMATLVAMQQLERAQRQVQQRDALLLEARAELAGANAGRHGRHSGARVGDYQVGELIGRGAMGEVYEATSEDGGLALKILHPELVDDPTHLARFLREAELTQKLDSPHIVKVLGSGRTDEGAPFVAMELLGGEDLGQHLRSRKSMELGAVVEMVQHVARGLDVAQEMGIVHRDLKPQNVFLARDGGGARVWKVLDFGVAALAEASGELTRGDAVGTPHYMSPEQTRGETVDHRSDVFALGSIAYRALTGQPAFAAADSMAAMYRVNRVQPMKPSLLAPLPADVDLALALALAKDRSQRFRSASTFAAALRDASRGELDEPYRVAARALLARHGWMKEVR